MIYREGQEEEELTTRLKFSCGLYYKCFTIVIYDCNDIALYYKTRDDRN